MRDWMLLEKHVKASDSVVRAMAEHWCHTHTHIQSLLQELNVKIQ